MKPYSAALPLTLLALALAAVFGLLAWSPFLYDDPQFITGNAKVTGPWPGWLDFFLSPVNAQGDFEHLVYLLHRALYALVGDRALWYRLTSIMLHWLNAALAYILYRRFLQDGFLAGAAALLFALYPGHVETLAVSMYKTHLLVAFFGLGMIVLTLRTGKLSRSDLGLIWLAMALALLTKETALMLPCLLGLAAWHLPKPDRPRIILGAGLAALCAGYVFFRLYFLPHRVLPPVGGNWPDHLATSLKCLLWYFSQFPLPWGLCFEHSLSPAGFAGPQALLLLLSFLVFLVVFFACRRFDVLAWCGLAWMLLALLPFINLMPFLNFSLVINRYLYLAAAGFFLFLARLLQKLFKRRAQAAVIASLIFIYSAVDLRYGVLFATPLDLWTHTATCAHGNLRAHVSLAEVLMGQGLYPEAVAQFKQAILLSGPMGGVPGLQSALAAAYSRGGENKKAVALMLNFAKKRPNAPTFERLGTLLLEDKQSASAAPWLEKAKNIAPHAPSVRLHLGLCYLQLGRLDEAEKEFRFSLGFPENRAPAFKGLAEIYARRKRRRQAMGFYEKAMGIEGFQPDTVRKLAGLYIQDGRPAKARELYREALGKLAASARFKPLSAEHSRRIVEMTTIMAEAYRRDEKSLFFPHGRH